MKAINNDIEVEEDEHCEVEKILKHRKRNKTLQYLVKWKDSDEQTWEPDYHFDTTEIIDDYWKEINKTKPNQVLLCLTNISKALRIISSNITFFLLFMCILCVIDTQIIKERVKFCDIQNREIWDLPESCVNTEIKPEYFNDEYFILSKITNEFDTLGTVCSKKLIRTSAYVNFFGSQTIRQTEEIIVVSKSECDKMRISKSCDKIEVTKMKCQDDYCESTFVPKIRFTWLTPTYNFYHKCVI